MCSHEMLAVSFAYEYSILRLLNGEKNWINLTNYKTICKAKKNNAMNWWLVLRPSRSLFLLVVCLHGDWCILLFGSISIFIENMFVIECFQWNLIRLLHAVRIGSRKQTNHFQFSRFILPELVINPFPRKLCSNL